MATKLLGYDDAVKLLGGESKLVAALSKVAGAGLAGAGLVGLAHGNVPVAVHLFELKDEVVSLSEDAVKTLRHRLTGLSRFERSELLEAAHAVLVVSAFFAALDDLDTALGTALNSASLDLVKAEQAALASSSSPQVGAGLADLARQLTMPGRIPGLDGGLTGQGQSLADYYINLAKLLRRFAVGAAVWDRRDETTRDKWSRAVTEGLPRRALVRYEEQLVRLSGEFPEFAFWAHRVGTRAILEELRASRRDTAQLGTTLQTVTGLLAAAARGPDPGKVRSDLLARYRERVAKPIAGVATGAVPEGVQLPALQRLYINPSYKTLRLFRTTGGIEQITDPRWRGISPHGDLGAMVLEHLISTEAARVPLVLLGQPGAGKSVFTQMLAAELDPRDYLVVWVELRAVPSDAGIQEQIEAALENLTGRSIRWPDLTESAGHAQPVILLDGFDELLQASGVSHFAFLEQIQAFQQREAELRRPVAVIVTSRIAVANQVRYPDGTPVVRLEGFDTDQVGDWLDVWNKANPGRPLAVQTALAQGELAGQPLLLFLLALFHSGGGNLTPGISQAHLFDRLFIEFVERDVEKLDSNLTERQQQHKVQRDLDYLSIVAFSMFNRGRQSVTEADLITDLTALQPESSTTPGPKAREAALSIAEQIAGRFFFRLLVHRDQAMRGQQLTLNTYEFLHASFGEFLVARWVVGELSRLGEQARRAADDPYPSPPDDNKLHALLSVTVLSAREQRVLGFIADLLTEKTADDLADLRAVTGALFRGCLQQRSHNPYSQYQPSVRTAPATYAAYSANLLLLLLLINEAQFRTAGYSGDTGLSDTELDVLGATPVSPGTRLAKFQAVTRLWHSQLTPSEWESLLDVVRIHQQQEGITASSNTQGPAVTRWTEIDHELPISGHQILYDTSHPYLREDDLVRLDTRVGKDFREAALLGATGYLDTCSALLPYINAVGLSRKAPEFQVASGAAAMLTLLIPGPGISPEARIELYKESFKGLPGIRPVRMLLERLNDDIRHFPITVLANAIIAATPYAWAHVNVYLDILARAYQLAASQGRDVEIGMPELMETGAFERERLYDTIATSITFDKFTLLALADPKPLLGLSYSAALTDLTNPHELGDLLRLTDPGGGEVDAQELLGIYDFSELIRLLGVIDLLDLQAQIDPVHLRDLNDMNGQIDWEDPTPYPTRPSLIEIALWAGLAQRGLPAADPPDALMRSDVKRLESIVPDFVLRIGELAAEAGFRSPLPRTVQE